MPNLFFLNCHCCPTLPEKILTLMFKEQNTLLRAFGHPRASQQSLKQIYHLDNLPPFWKRAFLITKITTVSQPKTSCCKYVLYTLYTLWKKWWFDNFCDLYLSGKMTVKTLSREQSCCVRHLVTCQLAIGAGHCPLNCMLYTWSGMPHIALSRDALAWDFF